MVSMEEYERAEREVILAEWKHRWRVHALWFLVVNAILAFASIGLTDGLWFVYPLVAWAIVLAWHYRLAVRHGEIRLREQQVRVAWRATREQRRLLPH